MTRVLSALVLLPVVIGTIWFLPPIGTLGLSLIASVLAFREYRTIAAALGVSVSAGIGAVAVALVCYAVWAGDRVVHAGGFAWAPSGGMDFVTADVYRSNAVPLVLMSAFIAMGAASVARGRPATGVLSDAAATMLAPIYIGLPLGALAWIREPRIYEESPHPWDPRVAVLLLLAVIVVSDSAQYYTGRAFGRHALAPTISPKKTVEGAIGGVVFGTLATTIGGRSVFGSPLWVLALLGAAMSLLGIVGDLFESLLKRSAGVKDSSHLIPGHGGVLDRIDSWLFAAPVYYMYVRFIA
jgi:phosphatidate cytidylyltransferase